MRGKCLLLLSFSLFVTTIWGCGNGRPGLVPVSGTVTLNGEPVADADVYFQVLEVSGDYNRPSNGKTDAQGKFTIGTYGKEDGVPVGKYRVAVIKKVLQGNPDDVNWEQPDASAKPIKYIWETPQKYADPQNSGLTVEVTNDGMSPPTIELSGTKGEVEVIGRGGGGA